MFCIYIIDRYNIYQLSNGSLILFAFCFCLASNCICFVNSSNCNIPMSHCLSKLHPCCHINYLDPKHVYLFFSIKTTWSIRFRIWEIMYPWKMYYVLHVCYMYVMYNDAPSTLTSFLVFQIIFFFIILCILIFLMLLSVLTLGTLIKCYFS